MLRIWACGIYERDSSYEIADRLDIMLWHDFMFACRSYVYSHLCFLIQRSFSFSYSVDNAFLLNIRKEILYQVQRLQSRPPIILWTESNENEGIPAEQKATKNDYRKFYTDWIQ